MRVLTILSLLLAACLGAGIGACTGARPATPTATPTAPLPPLVVASDLDNLPFAGVDANGRAIGRDVEMMERLAAGLGREVEWRRMPFDELLPAVERAEVDVVCATLGITAERARRVLFSEPYFDTSITVVVRLGPGEPTSLADLTGRRVAAGAGTTSEGALRAHLPGAVGVFENKQQAATADRLYGGEVDGAVMDAPAADALVAASGGRLGRLVPDLERERYALALPPGRSELKAQLDRELARLGP